MKVKGAFFNGTKPVDNITQIIGNTPVVKLRNVVDEDARCIRKIRISKSRWFSKRPYRISYDRKRKRRKIKPGDTIVEPTSGNTGIGLAFVCD